MREKASTPRRLKLPERLVLNSSVHFPLRYASHSSRCLGNVGGRLYLCWSAIWSATRIPLSQGEHLSRKTYVMG